MRPADGDLPDPPSPLLGEQPSGLGPRRPRTARRLGDQPGRLRTAEEPLSGEEQSQAGPRGDPAAVPGRLTPPGGDSRGQCDAWLLGGHGEQDSLDQDIGTRLARPTFVIPNVAKVVGPPPERRGPSGGFRPQRRQDRGQEGPADRGPGAGEDRRSRESSSASPNSRHQTYVRAFEEFVEGSRHQRWIPNLASRGDSASLRCGQRPCARQLVRGRPAVDLEAAAAGCRVVTTTHGHTSEYLGDWAVYWSPDTGERGLHRGDRDRPRTGPDREQGLQLPPAALPGPDGPGPSRKPTRSLLG